MSEHKLREANAKRIKLIPLDDRPKIVQLASMTLESGGSLLLMLDEAGNTYTRQRALDGSLDDVGLPIEFWVLMSDDRVRAEKSEIILP